MDQIATLPANETFGPTDSLLGKHVLGPVKSCGLAEFKEDTIMLRNWKMVLGAAVLLTAAVALVVWGENGGLRVVRAQTARGGPIHGYVGAALAAEVAATVAIQGPVINLPDISVFAKNLRTGVSSAPVKTNPQGYF